MHHENPDPAAAIRRILDGDVDSFRLIVHACEDDVRRVASSLLEGRDGTRDLVQQTFIRVYQHLDRFDPARGDLRPWVKGIARHVVQGELRRRAREQARLGFYWEHLSIRHEGAEEDEARMERLRAQLRACIKTLRGDAARVIELRYGKGASMDEISRLMNRTSATALKLLSRARIALRDCVERRLATSS